MKWKTRKWLVIIFMFILFVPNIFISASTHPTRGWDFRWFLEAGNRFIDGEFLYSNSGVATNVTWPPFFAVFMSLFSLLSRLSIPLTQVVWYLINAFLFLLTVDIWCRLFYNRPLGWFDKTNPHSFYSWSVFIPIALVAHAIFKVFVPLQINILMLFLMSLSFLHLKKNKDELAGVWLGLAIAIKIFPILITPYLLYRKKFKAFFWVVITAICLTSIPVLRYGLVDYWKNIMAWKDIALVGGYPLGGLNQSVYAMIGRWVASDPFALITQKLPAPAPDSPESITALWIYRLFYAALFALFLIMLHRRKYKFLSVEAAFLIVMSCIFSPLAWRNYWIIIFPGYFVLYNFNLRAKNRFLSYTIWISFFLVTVLQIVDQISKTIGGFFQVVFSNLTLGALMLMVGLLFIIHKNPELLRSGIVNETGHPAIES